MKQPFHSSRKQRPPRHNAVLVAGMVLLAAGAVSASQKRGYLAVTGPLPVRFEAPHVVLHPVALPPLVIPKSPSASTNNAATNPAPASVTSLQPTNAPVATEAASTVSQAAAPQLGPPPPLGPAFEAPNVAANPWLNPQGILEYLSPVSTNGSNGRVLVPVFVPPTPPLEPRSSHATYEVR